MVEDFAAKYQLSMSEDARILAKVGIINVLVDYVALLLV